MHQPVLRATPYVNAVRAVHRSERLWHRLDEALGGMPENGRGVREASETFRLLDVALHSWPWTPCWVTPGGLAGFI